MKNGLMQKVVGFFKGFSEFQSGLEWAAEMVSPYHTEFRPGLGGFVLVALDQEHMVLGRITRFFPAGQMSSYDGDEYLASLARMNMNQVPEDIKETKLRYNVHVKLLGGIVREQDRLTFNPAVRLLPHLGALVGIPTQEVVDFICRLGALDEHGQLAHTASAIGHLANGDTVYDGNGRPSLPVYFDIRNLVGRRTFVFARAGYGKSNLIKLLTAELYSNPALGQLQAGRRVGMLVFDPEGEYAFPDSQGRPGLVSVPGLQDRLVIYTSRTPPTGYQRWVQGPPRVHLGHLHPAAVMNICIPREKQDMVFANMVRGLKPDQWAALVQALEDQRYRISIEDLKKLLQYGQDSQALMAVPNNIVPLIQSLHHSGSTLAQGVIEHLAAGRVVVVDISLLGSAAGERLAGLLLEHIFTYNQERFTGDPEKLIPTIAVLEEAQSVLGEMNDQSPFVRWTKEGRKYQLGSILVTQQPGSIAPQLLSQGDNFFAFHLISAGDLDALQRVNGHFSRDVLMHLMNEPIRGNAYFWSAPHQPFVLAARIASFDAQYGRRQADAVPETTPAEAFRADHEKALFAFDQLVKATLENNFKVSLRENPLVDGQERSDLVAVNLFNVCLGIGELPGAREVGPSFLRDTAKGPVARDAQVLDALQRLGLLFAVAQPANSPGKGQQRLVLLLRNGLELKEGRRFQQYQGPGLVAG